MGVASVVPQKGGPVGRPRKIKPAKYRDNYPAKLIEHMRDGNPFASFGAEVGCSKQTLYNWMAAHPEFAEAREIGRSLALKWWIDAGKANLVVPKSHVFNQAVWIFTMRNMFNWTDKVEESDTNQENKPIRLAYDPSNRVNPPKR